MLLQYITGFDDEQFNELYRRIEEISESRPARKGGPKETLSLDAQLAATLMLLRHNVTEELVAEIFGITQSAISKIKDRIEPVLTEATGFSELSLAEAAANRQIVVDGTYVPTGTVARPGKPTIPGNASASASTSRSPPTWTACSSRRRLR